MTTKQQLQVEWILHYYKGNVVKCISTECAATKTNDSKGDCAVGWNEQHASGQAMQLVGTHLDLPHTITCLLLHGTILQMCVITYAKQKHLGCKKIARPR